MRCCSARRAPSWCANGSWNSASGGPCQSSSASASAAAASRGRPAANASRPRALQGLEQVQVERVAGEHDSVAGRARLDQAGRELLAELRDEDLHHLPCALGDVFAPKGVDQRSTAGRAARRAAEGRAAPSASHRSVRRDRRRPPPRAARESEIPRRYADYRPYGAAARSAFTAALPGANPPPLQSAHGSRTPQCDDHPLHGALRRAGGVDRNVARARRGGRRPRRVHRHGRPAPDNHRRRSRRDGSARKRRDGPPFARASALAFVAAPRAQLACERSGSRLRRSRGRAGSRRDRRCGADHSRDARSRRMGAERAPHTHAVMGARRPARCVDRRYAARRSRRRLELAVRLARASVRGGRHRRRPRGEKQRPRASAPTRAAGVGAVLRDRTVAPWLVSELLANSAWAGTLVYAGALFAEVHGASPSRQASSWRSERWRTSQET